MDLLPKGVVLLHYNGRQHSSAATVQVIWQLKCLNFSPNPLYSPDLAPLDYHVFGPLKEASRGQRNVSDEVKHAIHTPLLTQPRTLFVDGIRKVLNRYTIFVETMR